MKLTIYITLLSSLLFNCKVNDNKNQDNSLLLAGLVLASSTSTGSTNNTASTSRTRAQVLDDYNNFYKTSAVTTLGWTGSTTGCVAGVVSSDTDAKVLQRVNYFRRQVGLPDTVTLDSSVQSKVQEAALIMQANSTLTHTPSSSMTCYTTGGSEAAGKSNIALGAHSSAAISLYIQDSGTSNYAVGHRRWILYSKLDKIGHGSTASANALWVIGYTAGSTASLPEFVSWPPKGYVANDLAYARWSFSIPNQNAVFTNATVTMTDSAGAAISITRETIANGYGDNTIVWVPAGINTSSTNDVTYKVNISNVTIAGVAKSYSYDVTIFKP